MTNPAPPHFSTAATRAPALVSLVVPGGGQFWRGQRWRGLIILAATVVLAFLVQWALVEHGIGQVPLRGLLTSWLWLPFALFWAWNVWDARQIGTPPGPNPWPGLLCAGLIVYVVAWQTTDVKLERLVTRFEDAKKVMRQLVTPELATVPANGEDLQTCDWACLGSYFSDRLAGRPPAQAVKLSDNVLDIFGRFAPAVPPGWMVTLGLAAPGQKIITFQAGKMVETIAIGLMATLFSTLLAFPLSFLAAHNLTARLPGGQVIYTVMRGLFNVVRAVDTVVWGLIIIVWVGLGNFAGVIALTIHSAAALGKLYSEELEHIDPGPVEALTATGANLLQIIRYAVIPQITPSFLAYTLLRWDINMRSATVIGFVAGGGIGFFVVETIRAGAYQQYATALWVTAVVIILVDYISARLRENILKDQPRTASPREQTFGKLRRAFYIVVGVALFLYCWQVTEISLKALFAPAPTFLRLVGDFVKLDLSPGVLETVTGQMLTTIFQALLATTFGALLALPFSFLGARNLTGGRSWLAWAYFSTRSLFNVLRSIEALLYVAIFVAWVGIGSFAGMLALAVTTFALIGKLFSEAIENIEPGSIEAVTATGADTLQVIAYAIVPQIVPAFVSYLVYQWDINIRMATIIGFAGGGGIGLTLSTFFGSLQYHKAGTIVAFIVIVVALMDFTSAKLREQLI